MFTLTKNICLLIGAGLATWTGFTVFPYLTLQQLMTVCLFIAFMFLLGLLFGMDDD